LVQAWTRNGCVREERIGSLVPDNAT